MKTAEMPGVTTVTGAGAKSKPMAYFEDAWADVYNAEGRGTKEIMHSPSYFGDDNNVAYELDEAVKSERAGLVMTKYPDDKRDRFHIMSPCKADLVVEAHDDDGFCKCEELYEADKVYYKMQKFMCSAKEMLIAVPINADGTCPETYMYKGTEHEISVDTDAYEMDSFTCDADEDQEECIFRNTHEDPCTDDDDEYGDGCLKVKYRNCYGSDDVDLCAGTTADCDSEGHCVGVYSAVQAALNFHPAVAASTHQDTFAVPVNMKPHVNVDKSSEPVNICKNSWASKFLGGASGKFNEPCVSVAYDVVSMRGYSKEGFGVNYCGENKAQFRDKLEKTCFWGGHGWCSCCVCTFRRRYRDRDCAGGYRFGVCCMRENTEHGEQMAS